MGTYMGNLPAVSNSEGYYIIIRPLRSHLLWWLERLFSYIYFLFIFCFGASFYMWLAGASHRLSGRFCVGTHCASSLVMENVSCVPPIPDMLTPFACGPSHHFPGELVRTHGHPAPLYKWIPALMVWQALQSRQTPIFGPVYIYMVSTSIPDGLFRHFKGRLLTVVRILFCLMPS